MSIRKLLLNLMLSLLGDLIRLQKWALRRCVPVNLISYIGIQFMLSKACNKNFTVLYMNRFFFSCEEYSFSFTKGGLPERETANDRQTLCYLTSMLPNLNIWRRKLHTLLNGPRKMERGGQLPVTPSNIK